MNADYVENIIRNIDKQSYKCILVDGAWGIGKSYVVEKALEDKKDRTCMVSLFGMEDVQQIYHEILYQLLLHTSNGGKIVEFLKDSFRILGNFDDRAKSVSTILESHFSEEDMVNSITRKFDEGHIVVFDDIDLDRELAAIEGQSFCIFEAVVDIFQKQILESRTGSCFFDEIFQASCNLTQRIGFIHPHKESAGGFFRCM